MAIKPQQFDAIISGAGIPGLTLGLLLAGAGLKIAMADPAPPPAPDAPVNENRTAALMHASVNVLRAAGLWDDLAPYGAPLQILRIVENSTRRGEDNVTVDFDANDIGLPWFGINIPIDCIRAVLGSAARAHKNITMMIPGSVENFSADDTGISITMADGLTARARILIAADGRESSIRAMAGIETDNHDCGQSAITCVIHHTRPHHDISTEHHRPGGPFTIVPLPDRDGKNRSSIVWVEYNDDADSFMRLRRDDFRQALQDRTGHGIGTVSMDTNPTCWPLKIMRAKSLTAPRIALMAEAAHVLHPLGAQGLNLSLRDAAVLAETIVDAARTGMDIGSRGVLNHYESRRRPDIMTRVGVTAGLNKMVSNDIGILRYLRRAGLQTVGSVTPLKKFAMHEGIMPGYDDSRLSRGEEL